MSSDSFFPMTRLSRRGSSYSDFLISSLGRMVIPSHRPATAPCHSVDVPPAI